MSIIDIEEVESWLYTVDPTVRLNKDQYNTFITLYDNVGADSYNGDEFHEFLEEFLEIINS